MREVNLKRVHKVFLASKGLKPDNWRVQEETEKYIIFIHKVSKNTRLFQKPL